MKGDFSRMAQNQPMGAMDIKRYQLAEPAEDAGAQEWKAAVDNGLAQVQHQAVRIENLELMSEHGPMAYRMFNAHLEGVHATVTKRLEATKAEITEINKKRKLEQIEGAYKVRELEMQWDEISRKNIQIDAANQALDRDIEKMKSL